MKTNLFFVVLVLLFANCSEKTEETIVYKTLESKMSILVNKTDSLEQINENLIKINDSLQTQILQLEKVKFELDPGNWIYEMENPGGGSVFYILYNNGDLVITNDLDEDYYNTIGSWNLKNDFLYFNSYKIVYQRGVGDMIDFEGGIPNLPDWALFNEHVLTVKMVTNEDKWAWEGWKSEVRTGSFIKIIDNKPSEYPFSKFNKFLDGDYTKVSQEKINKAYLEMLKFSKDELRLMKNEIYARYGYIFKSADLNEHFLSKKWYDPNYENVDKYLSEIELHNIEVINNLINMK